MLKETLFYSMAGVDSTHSTDEYDVLGGYLPAFVQHLHDTRARLGIGVGSQVGESAIDASGIVVDAQASDWTPAERDAFFRALSVYSRWRPDLIAACVPTKSEWDVWTYLEALEEGAAALAVQDDDDDVDAAMQVDDEADADTDSSSGDEDVDFAVEVTQAWIDVEERMALWIAEEEQRVVAVAEDGAPKRRRGRPRGAGKGRAQSLPALDDGRSFSAEPADACEPQRRALMRRLEIPHLLVLDGVLRGDDEANKARSESREGSVAATCAEHGDEGEPYVRDGEEPSSSTRIKETSDISDAMIDPALLALSGHADPTSHQDTTALAQPPSLESGLQPTAVNAAPDLSLFSPRSRRRIQKRLYMRRKRANNEGTVDTGLEKLKPGKKAKSERKETPVVSTSPPSDAEEETTEHRKTKGGLTLPYKLRAQFAELGIDGAYLRNQGMDLLNLGTLGKLMGMWTRSGPEDAGQSIDAELICHLQAAMVLFMTDIIHRAIVWREREIRLKQRSQGWRQGDHITVAAIEHAVAAVGARYRSHKEYFESLGHSEASEHPTKAPSVDGDGEAAELSPEVPRFSPHRDVYTPLMRPPPGWRMTALSCLARTYEREATRTRRGPSAELEDELMSNATDEAALAAELAEDGAVDEQDVAADEGVEAGLFEKIRFNFI